MQNTFCAHNRKVIALNLFASFLVLYIGSWLLFFIAPYVVIAHLGWQIICILIVNVILRFFAKLNKIPIKIG